MTSFVECTQGFGGRLLPLTMCEYDVDCEGVADLRDEVSRSAHGVTFDEIACAWLAYQVDQKEAPSWLVADRLKLSGHGGMLVRSFVPQATPANINLVLWRWGPRAPHRVRVFDPSGRLPKNKLSWPKAR